MLTKDEVRKYTIRQVPGNGPREVAKYTLIACEPKMCAKAAANPKGYCKALQMAMWALYMYPEICEGYCTTPEGKRFPHVWLEYDGMVIDLAAIGISCADNSPFAEPVLPVLFENYNEAPFRYEVAEKTKSNFDWEYIEGTLLPQFTTEERDILLKFLSVVYEYGAAVTMRAYFHAPLSTDGRIPCL